MSAGADIAAEVAAAIREAGAATGDGPNIVYLIRKGEVSGPEYEPIVGEPTRHPLAVLDENVRQRDQSGTLIGRTTRHLMVEAKGIVPRKGEDKVEVGGEVFQIDEAIPERIGGVALFYTLVLGNA